MRVLHRLADRDEQLQPLPRREVVLVAVAGDRHALDQLHDEVGPAGRSVVPASSTRAMFGWSIRASACRSASKRAMTCRESMPALMSLTATRRLTGSVCWAIQTRAHAAFADLLDAACTGRSPCRGSRGRLVDGRPGVPATGRSSRLSVRSAASSRRQDVGDPGLVAAARLPDVLPPTVRVGDVRAAWKIASLSVRDAVMRASASGRLARPEHNARNRAEPEHRINRRMVSLISVRFLLRFGVDQFLGLASKELEFDEVRRCHVGPFHSRELIGARSAGQFEGLLQGLARSVA